MCINELCRIEIFERIHVRILIPMRSFQRVEQMKVVVRLVKRVLMMTWFRSTQEGSLTLIPAYLPVGPLVCLLLSALLELFRSVKIIVHTLIWLLRGKYRQQK